MSPRPAHPRSRPGRAPAPCGRSSASFYRVARAAKAIGAAAAPAVRRRCVASLHALFRRHENRTCQHAASFMTAAASMILRGAPCSRGCGTPSKGRSRASKSRSSWRSASAPRAAICSSSTCRGAGKTIGARSARRPSAVSFGRVQFTSDLLPSDVLGVSVYDQRSGEFTLKQGPIFANVLLADEINRASLRTQSALLEAMNEGYISTGRPDHSGCLTRSSSSRRRTPRISPARSRRRSRSSIAFSSGCACRYPPPQGRDASLLDRQHRHRAGRSGSGLRPVAAQGLPQLQRARCTRCSSSRLAFRQLSYTRLIQAHRDRPPCCSAFAARARSRSATVLRLRPLQRGRNYHRRRQSTISPFPRCAPRPPATHADGFMPTRDEAEAALREIVARVPVPL